MTSERTPAFELTAWLEQRLSQAAPGERFPSDRALARRFGLSERTVRTIMSRLARNGMVSRVRGSGTFKPRAAIADKPHEPLRPTAAQSIASRIHELIVKGELKSGEALPQVKFLCRSFRVAPATVSQAYRILQQRGVAVRVGRKCFAGNLDYTPMPVRRKRVFFFSTWTGGFRRAMAIDGMLPGYRKMEKELMRHGYRVAYFGPDELDTLMATGRLNGSLPDALAVGYVPRHQYDSISSRLVRFVRKASPATPPALMFSDAAPRRMPREINLLCHGNIATNWTRTLARFLLGRHVTAVTLFYDATRALRGPFTFASSAKLYPELLHFGGEVRFRVVIRSDNDTDVGALLQTIWPESSEGMIETVMGKYRPMAVDRFEERIRVTRAFDELYHRYRDDSAWLFSSATSAAQALQWCREHGVTVPDDLAIVAFENNPDFFHHSISTCIVDDETIGYQMAQSLIGDIPVARTSRGYIRPAAMVLERATTA